MSPLALGLCLILLIGSAAAADVPFVFNEKTSNVADFSSFQIEQASTSSSDLKGVPPITQAADDQVLAFPVVGGGGTPAGMTNKSIGDLKKTLDSRVEPDNPVVHDEAVVIALKFPGDHTIDQIASVYSFMRNGDSTKKGWGYVDDPRGLDYFAYANESLRNGGKAGCVGGGDCDDFAILMSALIESVGGTTRIILAHNSSTGGHAYAEVYLGKADAQDSQVRDIIDWLEQEFHTDKIFTHIDTDTKDIWLNLDWFADHPGGPFYQGDKHIVLCIRDRFGKTALRLPDQSHAEVVLPDQNLRAAINVTLAHAVTANVTICDYIPLINEGSYEAALECCNKDIERVPFYRNWPDGYDWKGVILCYLGRYDEALICFDQALNITPKGYFGSCWGHKGYALYKLGKYNEAIEAYDESIRIDPKDYKTWYNKGLALNKLGRTSEADAAFAKAKELGYKG